MAELLHLRDHPQAPLIAEGRAMRDVLERAAFYAKLRAPILLDGPTGTGKTLGFLIPMVETHPH